MMNALPASIRFLLLATLAFPFSLIAQEGEQPLDEAAMQAQIDQMIEEFGWQREGVGELKNRAAIVIPEGYRFTQASGAAKLMEFYGNLKTGREHGLIGPEDLSWVVLFEFDPSGYVKDDDKDSLDPDAMLKSMQQAQVEANKVLKERGLGQLFITGWAKEPYYNEETKNLEWATALEDEYGNPIVNLNTRILGRKGVMESVLICDSDQLDIVMDDYQELLTGYGFKDGERYADFREGDKIAKYGLTGLVVGAGALAAWKFGGKFIKFIIIGIAAAGAAIARVFGFGRKEA